MTAYLTTPFFIIRAVVYFVAWSYIVTKLYSLSLRQDVTSDHTIPAQQRKLSAWGLAVLAVTTAFASFDFMMSTDPHWFSTIFGVYICSGAFCVQFAAIVATTLLMQSMVVVYWRTV